MLRKVLVVAALLAVLPALAQAQYQEGDWALTLSGQANGGNDFDGITLSANGSLAYFITKEIALGVRQSVGYSDVNTDSNLNGSTRVAADYYFDLDRWQPFVGVNLGYVYGDAVADTWEAAPEVGVDFFMNSTTFIRLAAEYQFFFDKADQADDAFEDGQFVYTLGVGFRL